MTEARMKALETADPVTRLMNSVFTGRPFAGLEAYNREGDWIPATDVESDESGYTFRFDLPGVPKEAIEVNLEDGVLSVSGKRESESKVTEGNVHRRECAYGAFMRSFKLPRDADPDTATAKYDNGVLVLKVPKQESARPRRIEIAS
jgi:HSP20 family protein